MVQVALLLTSKCTRIGVLEVCDRKNGEWVDEELSTDYVCDVPSESPPPMPFSWKHPNEAGRLCGGNTDFREKSWHACPESEAAERSLRTWPHEWELRRNVSHADCF